jgi:hypothetical protein
MLIEATEADERRQRTEDRRQPFGTAQGLTASRLQRSDIRGLRSGIKLISDLRLLTSAINGFYDLNDFNEWNGF